MTGVSVRDAVAKRRRRAAYDQLCRVRALFDIAIIEARAALAESTASGDHMPDHTDADDCVHCKLARTLSALERSAEP